MLKRFQYFLVIIAGLVSICFSQHNQVKLICTAKNEINLCMKACQNILSFHVTYSFVKNGEVSRSTTFTIDKKDITWNDGYQCSKPNKSIPLLPQFYDRTYKLNIRSNCRDDSLNLSKNKIEEGNLRFYSIKDIGPKTPYNIRATWLVGTNNYQLNVSWQNPAYESDWCTYYPDKVIVSFSLSYNKIGDRSSYKEVNPSQTFLIESNLRESVGTYNQLKKIEICVEVDSGGTKSGCEMSYRLLEPPLPRQFDMTKVFVENSNLVILKPSFIDDFLSTIFVYANKKLKSEVLMTWKLDLEALIKDGNAFTDNLVLQANDNAGLRNPTIKSWNVPVPDKLKVNNKLTVVVFVVNEVNGYKSISTATDTYTLRSPAPPLVPPTTKTFYIYWTLLMLLLVGCLAFGVRCCISRIKRQQSDFCISTCIIGQNRPSQHNSTLALIETREYVDCLQHQYKVQTHKVLDKNFADYVKQSLENGSLRSQFKELPKYDKLKCTYGTSPENTKKNRYPNVVAFDHTLVKLSTGYVNANYVKGYDNSISYIASQDPLPHTLTDFWTMIWENNVEQVIMVTYLYEGTKKQCEQYWPEQGVILKFGQIMVKLQSVVSYPTYDVRVMNVRFGQVTKTVTQRHFKAWPKKGNALYPRTVVPFVTSLLKIRSKGPILVHCSAGIGRTGVIILCDIMLRMTAAEGAVDFYSCVKRMRQERPNMVPNFDLYKLAHLVVLAGKTVMDTRISGNMEKAIEQILYQEKVTKQFEYIEECAWQDEATKPENVASKVPILSRKNRKPHLLPDKTCQVFLNQLPDTTASSQYINAIDIGGVIVTQHPLTNTVSDFWRMVSEKECNVIVNLNLPADSEIFWPTADRSTMKLENGLTLNHIEEEKTDILEYRRVQIEHQVNDFEVTNFTVVILSFTRWPSTTPFPESIASLADFVFSTKSLVSADIGTIITCFDGATASGIYIALSMIYDQIQQQNECDVCQTVKELKTYRKEFIESKEHLELLYRAVLAYLKRFSDSVRKFS